MSVGARYTFELLVRDWAERAAVDWCGRPAAFFVGLRDDASPRRVYFAPVGTPFDAEQKTSLADAHPRWLLYVPHEDGTYLEWLGLPAPLVERWIGRPLDARTLAELSGHGSRGGWPESWRVMLEPPRSA